MALIRALWDAAYLHANPDFKEAPYDLGSFDEIAHYRGGRAGRAAEFKAGFDMVPNIAARRRNTNVVAGRLHQFEVTFGRRGTAPVPTKVQFGYDDVTIAEHVADDMLREIRFRTNRGEWMWQVPAETRAGFGADRSIMPHFVLYPGLVNKKEAVQPIGDSPKFSADERRRIERLFVEFSSIFPDQRPFASAPVRSKPQRTYDPSRPSRDPEGETIPMYLSTAFFEDKTSWSALKEALEGFGGTRGYSTKYP